AFALRELLTREGLQSGPKLTGGKGVHVVASLADRSMTHDEAHQYSKRLALKVAASDPARYTTSATMRERNGRLFLDYLRNGRGTTAVAAFSPRARPGFPIAAPVAWADLERGIRPDAFTIARLPPDALSRPTRASAKRNKLRDPVETEGEYPAPRERRRRPLRRHTHRS